MQQCCGDHFYLPLVLRGTCFSAFQTQSLTLLAIPLLLMFLVMDFFSYPSLPQHLSSLLFYYWTLCPQTPRLPQQVRVKLQEAILSPHTQGVKCSHLWHSFCFASHINSVIQLSLMQLPWGLCLPPVPTVSSPSPGFCLLHTWTSQRLSTPFHTLCQVSLQVVHSSLHTFAQIFNGSSLCSHRNVFASH